MKKVLAVCAAAALMVAFNANAEMIKGKVVDKTGNTLTVETENGQKLKMNVTEDTTYRQKKVFKKDRKKNGRMYRRGEVYYTPMVDEDDWIEVQYTPARNTANLAVVEDVIVYDD